MTTDAGSVMNPSDYGTDGRSSLPATLPYELGTRSAFDQTGFDGRPLEDDVMDVMLTLASTKALADVPRPAKK